MGGSALRCPLLNRASPPSFAVHVSLPLTYICALTPTFFHSPLCVRSEGMLNTAPYTIATATTGSCAFVELSRLRAGDVALDRVAAGAVRWLLASRTKDGAVPYILSPAGSVNVVFQPISCASLRGGLGDTGVVGRTLARAHPR